MMWHTFDKTPPTNTVLLVTDSEKDVFALAEWTIGDNNAWLDIYEDGLIRMWDCEFSFEPVYWMEVQA